MIFLIWWHTHIEWKRKKIHSLNGCHFPWSIIPGLVIGGLAIPPSLSPATDQQRPIDEVLLLQAWLEKFWGFCSLLSVSCPSSLSYIWLCLISWCSRIDRVGIDLDGLVDQPNHKFIWGCSKGLENICIEWRICHWRGHIFRECFNDYKIWIKCLDKLSGVARIFAPD